MARQRNISSALYHALFLLAVYILQALLFPFITRLTVIPVLLPLAAAGIAVFEGGARGGVAGFAAGILCDLSFNQPIAVFAVVLTALGILIGVLFDTVVARGFPAYLLCGVLALFAVSFTQMFALLFFERVPAPELIRTALRQTLVSALFTPPFYFICRALGRKTEIDK
jgi:cell shape-determining protein MreD